MCYKPLIQNYKKLSAGLYKWLATNNKYVNIYIYIYFFFLLVHVILIIHKKALHHHAVNYAI